MHAGRAKQAFARENREACTCRHRSCIPNVQRAFAHHLPAFAHDNRINESEKRSWRLPLQTRYLHAKQQFSHANNPFAQAFSPAGDITSAVLLIRVMLNLHHHVSFTNFVPSLKVNGFHLERDKLQ